MGLEVSGVVWDREYIRYFHLVLFEARDWIFPVSPSLSFMLLVGVFLGVG